ncbi:MAG: SDR family oxidoreductase [Planctomycetaceae bacterium]|nr:SDR family oxidoreductase [Planctomycetaceae bacterium]
MRFKNKVVLITGSSRNTGLGIAAAFLREGAVVYINGSTAEGTRAAALELRAQGYEALYELPGSIAESESVEKMFAVIRETTNRLDILVNNACQQGIGNSFESVPFEQFETVVKTNLFGTFYVSRCAVELMLKQAGGPGVIVNVTSNVSTRAIRQRAAYCASKGGIDALTRAMTVDLAPLGIRVNSVAPGYIHTERWDKLTAEQVARRRRNVPLGKEACFQDIAEAVMFLASDAAANICGVRLVVDGGCTAQHMPVDVDI